MELLSPVAVAISVMVTIPIAVMLVLATLGFLVVTLAGHERFRIFLQFLAHPRVITQELPEFRVLAHEIGLLTRFGCWRSCCSSCGWRSMNWS